MIYNSLDTGCINSHHATAVMWKLATCTGDQFSAKKLSVPDTMAARTTKPCQNSLEILCSSSLSEFSPQLKILNTALNGKTYWILKIYDS